MNSIYNQILRNIAKKEKLVAVLIDPDKFEIANSDAFLNSLPKFVTHIFVGGSTTTSKNVSETAISVKKNSNLPVVLFPGGAEQISEDADAILFLSLISGRNSKYLIEQQLQATPKLRHSNLEIIPTGYILIDGGKESAVQRVTNTVPLAQDDVENIENTALTAQYMGKKLIYLEAGSGALMRVSNEIISAIKKAINIPLIVGGGIGSATEMDIVLSAGADMVVIGTAFETHSFKNT